MSNQFKHNCPYCGSKRKTVATLVDHVKKTHPDKWAQTGSPSAAAKLAKAREASKKKSTFKPRSPASVGMGMIP